MQDRNILAPIFCTLCMGIFKHKLVFPHYTGWLSGLDSTLKGSGGYLSPVYNQR